MTNREDPDFAVRRHETIEREVAATAERDHELSQTALDDPTDR
jgi:hypothetical protein